MPQVSFGWLVAAHGDRSKWTPEAVALLQTIVEANVLASCHGSAVIANTASRQGVIGRDLKTQLRLSGCVLLPALVSDADADADADPDADPDSD